MQSFIRFLLKQPKFHRYLRNLYNEASPSINLPVPKTSIPEASVIECRESSLTLAGKRLNILLPALSKAHVFGGISTALSIFHSLRKKFDSARIILTDEQSFSHSDNVSYCDWAIHSLEDKDVEGMLIVPAGNRFGKTLAICAEDRFIATAWWTSYITNRIQTWQASNFRVKKAKYIYLIQDFEPGFYPWSSQYALAESTYRDTEDLIAIFNTGILRDFFALEGYHFPSAYTFEPHLNENLRKLRDKSMSQVREKLVLVYGRPSTPRNAFETIVTSLKLWISESDEAVNWQFLSLGELHPTIELGKGKYLISGGKLSLEEYALTLGRASIGISLMISPHPSYPPLEMAAFGMYVITNKYKNKDLASASQRIRSLASTSPQNIANSLDLTAKTTFSQTMLSFDKESSPSYVKDFIEPLAQASLPEDAIIKQLDIS